MTPSVVYLDHNASTPCAPEVVAEMLPYFSDVLWQPVERARLRAATARGGWTPLAIASPPSCACGRRARVHLGWDESDNFGVKGLALARGRGHVITSKVEHHAVLRSAQALEAPGLRGQLPACRPRTAWSDPRRTRRALRPDTIAISIMHANSEVGTIQPIRAIGAAGARGGRAPPRGRRADLRQVEIDVDAMNIDALSFSGHKIYGPKGIAGLYIRRGTKMGKVKLGRTRCLDRVVRLIQHGGGAPERGGAGTVYVCICLTGR